MPEPPDFATAAGFADLSAAQRDALTALCTNADHALFETSVNPQTLVAHLLMLASATVLLVTEHSPELRQAMLRHAGKFFEQIENNADRIKSFHIN